MEPRTSCMIAKLGFFGGGGGGGSMVGWLVCLPRLTPSSDPPTSFSKCWN